MIVETAIGGSPVTQTIEGRERFSVNVRLPQDYRNSIDRIKRIPIQTASMGTIPLSAVADIAFVNGPPMISSDNAMLRGRSEEHTSELQSLMRISYAVFCLKKKKKFQKRTQ